MTLFGGQLLTPAQRNESAMRRALELRRQFWSRKPGQFYSGGGDLLLEHGRFFAGRELPTEYQRHLGTMGRCFVNALLAAEADPSLRYCEGVYTFGGGFFVSHAWCLDPDGKLLEVSVPTDPASLAVAIEYRTRRAILPLDRWGYWGAPFDTKYVRAVFEAEDNAGLLDRPKHETYDSENMTAEEVADEREDWHVLNQRYDPTRTTL